MDSVFNFNWAEFLATMGANPFVAMWFIFTHGGFLFFIYAIGWVTVQLWLHIKQNQAGAAKEWIVLSISVPRNSEKDPGQSLRAVENIFSHLAGAHSPASWTERWLRGAYQDPISCEIVSIEGRVQFVIRCLRVLRDLVEASLFAQYPEAEIAEIEDYVNTVPHSYPDEDWDLWGTEMIPVKPASYPLKTYPEFENKMTNELKDPLAVLLEGFSRLGPGEHAWVQILAYPIDQGDYKEQGVKLIKTLKGEKIVKPPSLLDQIVTLPLTLISMLADGLMGSSAAPPAKANDPMAAKIFNLTPGERKILEAVENKTSKIGYLGKIRFIYTAKKNVFKKPKIVSSFVGFIKQLNTNDMQALKPETKTVGVNGALWFFKEKRNDLRKTKLMSNYRNRSVWYGLAPWFISVEELATLWHFPHTFQVKAPSIKKRELKIAEPPFNLPYA